MWSFNKRKTWYFGKNSRNTFGIEMSGFRSNPCIYFQADGCEREYTLHIGLIFGLWLSLKPRFLSDRWFPADYKEKEIRIAIHDWEIWWSLWMPTMEWSSKDPFWRHGNTSFGRWIFGKHTVEWSNFSHESFILPFLEGNYNVLVTKKDRIDRWQRWFTKKSFAWEVQAGYQDPEGFQIVPIPHEGKGENSWDQGEDGSYSCSFPGSRASTHYKAALYFWNSCMETRERYGRKNWLPRKFRPKEGEVFPHMILVNPVTD